jgi:hypothetical protein
LGTFKGNRAAVVSIFFKSVLLNAVSSGYTSSKSLLGVFPGPNRWPGNTPAGDFFSSNPDDPAFNNTY